MSATKPEVAALIQAHYAADEPMFALVVQRLISNAREPGEAELYRELFTKGEKAQQRAPKPAAAGVRPAAAASAARAPIPGAMQGYLYEVEPQHAVADLVLPEDVAQAAGEVLRDLANADKLLAHGLNPTRTLLMHGPPGTGKTSLAGALAGALGLPLYVLRIAGLRGSFVGQTPRQISNAFAVLQDTPCVLFLDEADSVLCARVSDNTSAGRGMSDDVNTMLTCLDEAPQHLYVFAATNRLDIVDAAALRRFELRLEVPRPGAAGLEQWFNLFTAGKLAKWEVTVSARNVGRAAAHRGDSFATLEQRCTRVLRSHVIDLPDSDLNAKLTAALLTDVALGVAS